MHFPEYRYYRWDGSQQVFPFNADEVMEALADELIDGGDMQRALERLQRFGDQGRMDNRMQGLRDLLERLKAQRQETLQRNNLNSVMDDIKKRLEEIVNAERAGIERRLQDAQSPQSQQAPSGEQPDGADQDGQDGQQQGQTGQQQGQDGQPSRSPRGQPQSQTGQQQGQQGGSQQQNQTGQQQQGQQGQQGQGGQQQGQEGQGAESGAGDNDALRRMLEGMAQRKQQYLDSLPGDVPGQIKSLSDYDFMDAQAREQFQELLKMLQQQVMQSYFQGMQQQIQNVTPEDLARTREMVRALNQMLEDRLQGKQPNFDEFMEKYGDFFPPGINSLDELMELMQQRMAQMQSLMQSMSPEQRQQLQSMMDQLLGDDRLRIDLARLAANMEQLMPMGNMPGRYRFSGDEPMSLLEAMAQMERLQGMDSLEEQIKGVGRSGGVDDINSQQVGDLLGPEAQAMLDQLKELTKMLEDAGYIQKNGDRWEMTPHGIRKIGQKALQDVFAHLKKDGFGRHNVDVRGIGGERTEDSKRYDFGDPFLLDIQKTIMNSVEREGPRTPVQLLPTDFEVFRTELLTQASTVLMLDMSRSMFLNESFAAAKKVTMALNSLIRGQYPRDTLHIVGFNKLAREIKLEDLPSVGWGEDPTGTNLHHALMLARKLLARGRGVNKQIIVITDGEPTAHLMENGEAFVQYPPTSRTILETLREVGRCTRENIIINTFMLDSGYNLTDFVNHMTKINKGRAFYTTPDRLGEYILVDYVANKRKKVS